MALETGKITIDDNDLLKRTAASYIEKEKTLSALPLPLDANRLPITQVIRPASFEPDPLRLRKLFSSTFATYHIPADLANTIFNINAIPSIGDIEAIDQLINQVKSTQSFSLEETDKVLKFLNALRTIEKDIQDIRNRLSEFVLG